MVLGQGLGPDGNVEETQRAEEKEQTFCVRSKNHCRAPDMSGGSPHRNGTCSESLILAFLWP